MISNDLAPTLPLDGVWAFYSDADGSAGEVIVPGCWEAQGFPKTLDGPVVYRRSVHIPATWAGQPVWAEFDAVSYAATVRCNGQVVGRHIGLWTPFAVDISSTLKPGQENSLEVEAVKPCHTLTGGLYPLRSSLAGFLPDIATTFGGLWQSARLRLLVAGFDHVHVEADPTTGVLRVDAQPLFPIDVSHAVVRIRVVDPNGVVTVLETLVVHDERLDVILPVVNPILWQPAQPALYSVHIELISAANVVAATTRRVGFRQLRCVGEKLLLNDQPISLRGVLSWGWDPAVIAPRVNAERVRSEMRRVAALGFNLIKLCLFIPNQIYYDIADEEGMLLWQEWPMWLPEVTPALRSQAPGEYADYMELTRHHPSVVVYSLGCELDQSVDRSLLSQLDSVVRSAAHGALCCDNSGSGEAYGGLVEDFADFVDYHTYGDLHYLELTLDHWRRDWRRPRPWLFGEFCDSDGYRNRARLFAAHGGAAPWWITAENPTCAWRPEMQALLAAGERLAAAQSGFTEQQLVRIANAQSLMVRKTTLEAVRKRHAVQGYVITGLIDTPIATSGILDDFGQPKWSADEFRTCNDAAILCLDVGRSRIWQHGGDRPERLDAHNWWAGSIVRLHVILNHSAAHAAHAGVFTWQVQDASGKIIAAKMEQIKQTLPAGEPIELAVVQFTAPMVDQPQSLTLVVQFQSQSVSCTNHWPLWIYPAPQIAPEAIAAYDPGRLLAQEWDAVAHRRHAGELGAWCGPLIATAVDQPLVDFLTAGGRVMLLQLGDGPLPARRAPFWRESLKLLTPHSLWQRFPNAGFADLQFWGMASDVSFETSRLAAMLPGLRDVTPILRRFDAREFTVTDYLFAATVGAGRLLGCSLRLDGGAGAQPTGLKRNVAGKFLLAALLELL